MSANYEIRLPEVIVVAGRNGSGKLTITRIVKTSGEYIMQTILKELRYVRVWKLQ